MERFIRTLIIIVLVTAGGVALFSEFSAYRDEQASRLRLYDSLLLAQQRTLEAVRADIDALRNKTGKIEETALAESRRLASQLEDEARRRAAIEAAQRASQETSKSQIASLEERIHAAAAPNVAAVIETWKPRVVSISCDWTTPLTNRLYLTKRGSGVLTRDNGGVYALTNKHVITDTDNTGLGASRCFVRRPGESAASMVEGTDIFVSNQGLDLGTIRVLRPSANMESATSATLPACRSRATVGTEIIILGFPQIGSESDITATEGIISGYDGNYYVTSAKVERGNSGGAAVALKDNCYLGIPTFVQVGDIESLARILDARVFLLK